MGKISAGLASFLANGNGGCSVDFLPPAPQSVRNPRQARVSDFVNANLGKNLGKKMASKLLYKPAKLYSAGGDTSATWYVYFSWRKTPQCMFKRKRITGDINRIPGKAERMEAGRVLARIVNLALESGYDPDAPIMPDLHLDTNIVKAMEDVVAVKKNGMKPKTLSAYKTHTNRFYNWLKAKGIDTMQADSLTAIHVNQHLDFLQKKGYHARTINKAMGILGGIYKKLHKLGLCEKNPFETYDYLKEPESHFFELFTDEELSAIFPLIKQKSPGLYLFALFIYYAYMRNNSIRMVQRKDIDFAHKKIIVYGENHKNGKTTVKQLVGPLYQALLEAGVDKMAGETYLFGTCMVPGKKPCGINIPARHWRDLVMNKMGIKKRIYGLKHTGGTHYKLDNRGREDLAWLQQQMGHSSLEETEAYVSRAGYIELDEKSARFRVY